MRKSTLFISVVLTTFMLAVLFGVVSAYKGIVGSTQTATQPTAEVAMVGNAPMPAQAATITPEAAAALASQVINRTDLYSAEITQLDGVDVYLITFSSGDLVYVSLDGKILSISKLAVTVITQARHGGGNNGGGNTVVTGSTGNTGGGGDDGGEQGGGDGGGEHEGGDD